MARIIVIAGVATGVGKTSITLGLLDALRRRGLRIQAFKVGPDFIDPGFHALATGRPSYTLDGWMCGRDEVLALPERHLGLVTAAEGVLDAEKLRRLGDAVDRSVDLNRLLSLAREVPPFEAPGRGALPGECRSEQREGAPSRRVRIGVARDAAFQFYYAENPDLLREAGAELHFWSPLDDHELPDVDGLYLGGGYPELHARRLSENTTVKKAVRRFAEGGRPVYAECGGLMYLAETLEDADGVAYPMAGVLPAGVRMRPRRMALGYTEVALTSDTPIGPAGAVARGHEFHYSTLDPVPD